MRGYKVAAAAVFAVTLTFTAANAWNRGNVQVLTVLPDLLNQSGQRTAVKSSVEGLTVGPDNNIYVTTFGFNTKGGTNGPAPFAADPLLGNGGGSLTPPFGANGVEFNKTGSILFVANTAFHQIIQIPWNAPTTSGGLPTPGTVTIFVTGINAPDGIAIDNNNNIWICANQEDEIVVVNHTGKVIAKLGDFDGIDPKGIVRGLLFPASLAFSNDGQWLYVSNLTLNLPFATMGGPIAIDSAWTLQVQGYTVSRLQARIPPIAGD
jgi:sugar lactone lactonase YvrE